MKIERNIGALDRTIRMVAGIALIIVGATVARGVASTVLYILSIPLLLSTGLGFRPSYTLLGLSTRKEEDCG